MSALEPTEATATSSLDDDDNLNHFWCCDPDRAHCGADLSGVPETDFDQDGEEMCVVCYDLQFSHCPKCEVPA